MMDFSLPRSTIDLSLPRSVARLASVQYIFMRHFLDREYGGNLDAFKQNFTLDGKFHIQDSEPKLIDIKHFDIVTCGVEENRGPLIESIEKFLPENLKFYKIEKGAASIIVCGAFEILHLRDIPKSVVINEYINIAKMFLFQKGSGFINAVLDKLSHEIQTPLGDRIPHDVG